ncbi:MAG: aldehyde ferredoxin oxidoreductase, partial [Promethearchaeota archaeon]
MDYYGFIGRILKVDLTDQSISAEKINLEHVKKFMGGAGYACRYLFDHLTKELDPLSSLNHLMIMTGPLSLTGVPSSDRFVICAKSPYTNLWGESNCGGFFGPEIKKAGYDGVDIIGTSSYPVYISIHNEDVNIEKASDLWGKGTKETHNKLKAKMKDDKAKVMCIGPGGENLIKYANVNAEGRSAGRTGMGAVMGSKKLKGIVVRGTKKKPKVANPEEFRGAIKKTLKFLLDRQTTRVLREYGTSAGVMGAYGVGDLPIKYWSKGEWDKVFDISGQKLKDEYLIKNKSCYGCPISCGRVVKIDNESYNFPSCEGAEYETIAGFGSMILNNNLDSINIANNLCNDYGIDTISSSSAIALLYNLYNEGKINREDVDGLDLSWGNWKSLLKLLEKIAFREGIGDILAEGSNAVAQKFDISSEKVATVNKLEVPYHDIRSCYGMALTYAFSPRGACHTSADVYKILRKSNEIDFSTLGIPKIDVFSNSKKMAKYTALSQDYRALYSSLISCVFSNPPPELMAKMMETLFGY